MDLLITDKYAINCFQVSYMLIISIDFWIILKDYMLIFTIHVVFYLAWFERIKILFILKFVFSIKESTSFISLIFSYFYDLFPECYFKYDTALHFSYNFAV